MFAASNNGHMYDDSLLITVLYIAFRYITGTIGLAWAATSTTMLKEILENHINCIWFCSRPEEKLNDVEDNNLAQS